MTAATTLAEQTFQTPEAFIDETFDGDPPQPKTVWLVGDLGERVEDALTHPPRNLRERYWRRENRTAWILEEIGKERPITVGWVIENRRIVRTKVLIYRESRGWEVRYPFFTKQFDHAKLENSDQLDRNIDNISGATLSVRAMRRMARTALILHQHVTGDGQTQP